MLFPCLIKNTLKTDPLFKPIVLIVEDNDFQINILSYFMKYYNIKYVVAKNGHMAVASYDEKSKYNEFFNLILMDIEMPFLDGFQATFKIRQIEKTKNYQRTFICGMSSTETKDIEAKCKEIGMDHFLKKPLRALMLIELINNISKESN